MKRALLFLVLTVAILAGCKSNQDSSNQTLEKNLAEYPSSLSCVGSEIGSEVENPFVAAREDHENDKNWTTLIGNPYARRYTSLNGSWQFIVDQLDMGDRGTAMRGSVGEGKDAGPHELIEYGFDDSQSMNIPGDWNSSETGLDWYRGVVWFKRDFDYSPEEGKRAILYFGGAYLHKDIYLNGQLISEHHGGFTAFNIDVTEKIRAGENRLVIKVDSRSGASGIPTEYNDWMNYGGITRDVMLVHLPEEYIHNYKIQLDNVDSSYLSGWIKLSGNVQSDSVQISIEETDVEFGVSVDSEGWAEFRVPASQLDLWSPDNPHRYKIKIQSSMDKVTDLIGFRALEVRGNDILLNKKPIFLRGISMHEGSFLRPGRAYNQEDAEATVKYLKDLNVNFVRLAHYQHNIHMIEAAESSGILIWEELPIYHSMDYSNSCTLESAKQQYSEMIARDQNRAAVIFWSVSNETPISEERNAFLRNLAIHVRHRDSTRLITSALFSEENQMTKVAQKVVATVVKEKGQGSLLSSFFMDSEPVTIVLNDPLGEIVDVIGYNQYLGWYISGHAADKSRELGLDVTEAEIRSAMLKEMSSVRIESIFNKPLIMSEFGAGAKKGIRGDQNLIWSEDYQLKVYQNQFKLLENVPDLRGMSPWVLKDFRAPYRLNNTYQNYWNRKGLVSETGVKKEAFWTLSEYYKNQSEAERYGKAM